MATLEATLAPAAMEKQALLALSLSNIALEPE